MSKDKRDKRESPEPFIVADQLPLRVYSHCPQCVPKHVCLGSFCALQSRSKYTSVCLSISTPVSHGRSLSFIHTWCLEKWSCRKQEIHGVMQISSHRYIKYLKWFPERQLNLRFGIPRYYMNATDSCQGQTFQLHPSRAHSDHTSQTNWTLGVKCVQTWYKLPNVSEHLDNALNQYAF